MEDEPLPTRPSNLAVLSLLTLLALAASHAAEASAPAEPFRFGRALGTIADLNDPSDVAVGADGVVRIAEASTNRILLYSINGRTLERVGAFGTLGDRDGALRGPEGVAVGVDGRTYVADTGNDRVQVFDAVGGHLATIGGRGREPGQFNRPTAIAVDGLGLYVADTGNDRVQMFDPNGRFLKVIGGPGGADDGLNRPEGVAIDSSGRIVIADTGHNRICVYDRSGGFVRSWGDYGPYAGLMDHPTGVACEGGRVYVADSRNHRIQVFGFDGVLIREWGLHARKPREGNGRLHYPERLAFAPDGSFVVIAEPFEDRCQVFAAARPGEEETPRPAQEADVRTHFGTRLALDGDLLIVPEPENHTVDVFDLRGESPVLVTQFGERGDRFGQLLRASGVAVDDSRGRVVVSDLANGRLQVFELRREPDGPLRFDPRMSRFVRAFTIDPTAPPFTRAKWPIEPNGLRRDRAGNLLVIDPRNAGIFVLDPDLDPLIAYGTHGGGPRELREPTDIAMNAAGNGYFIVDAGNHRIVHIDRRGGLQQIFGHAGEEPGAFVRPYGIAAGVDGFVYVTDVGAHRVLKFDEAGQFVTAWGEKGTGDGQLWKPTGIEQDDDGRLIVLDYGNHRAQAFDPDGNWLGTFGAGKATRPGDRPNPPAAAAED